MKKVIANKNGGIEVELTKKEISKRKAEEKNNLLKKQLKEEQKLILKEKKQALKEKMGLTDEEFSILMHKEP